MMLDEKLTKAANAVTEAIRDTQEYKDFEQQKKIVRNDPEATRLVERLRELQARLMDIPEDERNSDYVYSLQDEYEEITENTSVYEYSRAESCYMTMIQEVLGTVIEDLDIDI